MAIIIIVFNSSTAIDCSLLSDSEYGSVEITGTFPGSIATYACNKGFQLIGSDTRECRPSGEWSGQAPICKRKTN